MKRPVKWQMVTFGVAFCGLNLVGVAVTMAQPHLGGSVAAATATANTPTTATIVAAQSCADSAGNTGQGQAGSGSRARFLRDRRLGNAVGSHVTQDRGAAVP